MKPVKCPICNGSGQVRPLYAKGTETVQCHGCNGKGWVEVGGHAGDDNPYPQPFDYGTNYFSKGN